VTAYPVNLHNGSRLIAANKMPFQQIILSDEDHALLERVRLHQGLDSVEQAAEWLAKTRLRRQAKEMTGRGRAFVLVKGRNQK